MATGDVYLAEVWFSFQGQEDNIYGYYLEALGPPGVGSDETQLATWFESDFIPALKPFQATTLVFTCIDVKRIWSEVPGILDTSIGIQNAIAIPGTLTPLALPGQCSLVVQLLPNFTNSDPTRKGRDFYTGLGETQQTNGAWTTDAAQDIMDVLTAELEVGVTTANGSLFTWGNFSYKRAQPAGAGSPFESITALRALKHVRTQRRRDARNPCDKYISES